MASLAVMTSHESEQEECRNSLPQCFGRGNVNLQTTTIRAILYADSAHVQHPRDLFGPRCLDVLPRACDSLGLCFLVAPRDLPLMTRRARSRATDSSRRRTNPPKPLETPGTGKSCPDAALTVNKFILRIADQFDQTAQTRSHPEGLLVPKDLARISTVAGSLHIRPAQDASQAQHDAWRKWKEVQTDPLPS